MLYALVHVFSRHPERTAIRSIHASYQDAIASSREWYGPLEWAGTEPPAWREVGAGLIVDSATLPAAHPDDVGRLDVQTIAIGQFLMPHNAVCI